MLGGTTVELGDAYLRFSTGKGLGEIRTMRGKNIHSLAETVNISSELMKDYEKGQASLPIETLMRLLRCLDVIALDFFRDVLAMEHGGRKMTCTTPRSFPVVDLQVVRGG
ncbi:MAG: helix-turn-helix transcriptional regulator [Rhodobacter sp.]|nr:helix-turn-helix transcriptional regulator [Rhodobacter sp.]